MTSLESLRDSRGCRVEWRVKLAKRAGPIAGDPLHREGENDGHSHLGAGSKLRRTVSRDVRLLQVRIPVADRFAGRNSEPEDLRRGRPVERKSGGFQPTQAYSSRTEGLQKSLVFGSFRFL
jgi:hypothetical protein